MLVVRRKRPVGMLYVAKEIEVQGVGPSAELDDEGAIVRHDGVAGCTLDRSWVNGLAGEEGGISVAIFPCYKVCLVKMFAIWYLDSAAMLASILLTTLTITTSSSTSSSSSSSISSNGVSGSGKSSSSTGEIEIPSPAAPKGYSLHTTSRWHR